MTDTSEIELHNIKMTEKAVWLDETVRLLISIYSEVRPLLRSTLELRTKKRMWNLIREKMSEHGYYFTATQIENKFKSLNRKSKKGVKRKYLIKTEEDTMPMTTKSTLKAAAAKAKDIKSVATIKFLNRKLKNALNHNEQFINEQSSSSESYDPVVYIDKMETKPKATVNIKNPITNATEANEANETDRKYDKNVLIERALSLREQQIIEKSKQHLEKLEAYNRRTEELRKIRIVLERMHK